MALLATLHYPGTDEWCVLMYFDSTLSVVIFDDYYDVHNTSTIINTSFLGAILK